MMSPTAMPLAKWVSNSLAIAEVLHREFKDKFIVLCSTDQCILPSLSSFKFFARFIQTSSI